MCKYILANRLNKLIAGQQISKAEFARRFRNTAVHPSADRKRKEPPGKYKACPLLAKLISLEFGCDCDGLLHGKEPESEAKPKPTCHTFEGPLRAYGVTARENKTVMQLAEGKSIE